MEFIADLWLPILLSTFALWILSFVAWVIAPHHYGDRSKVADEEGLMKYLSDAGVGPGNYFFPYAGSAKQQGDKQYVERYTSGPRGTLNVYDMPNMAVNMGKTILYFFVTTATIAYITHVACPPADAASTFIKVFRIAGTIGVLAYGTSGALNRVWFVERMWTHIVDGVIYGVVAGLIFASMWPGA